ncbi:hypothetical protein [Catellatospora tritici]|uniref:hypothetical protein n=1 Tax=Catellatospora tritici TaxID=2851566 RepID=UPI001C2D7EC1|nr:hypothetical protein [Catellatospora tritici]MBV1851201.1 hypothetical protein [Catellatospora tritici]
MDTQDGDGSATRRSAIIVVVLIILSLTIGVDAYRRFSSATEESVVDLGEAFRPQEGLHQITAMVPGEVKGAKVTVRLNAPGDTIFKPTNHFWPFGLVVTVALPEHSTNPPALVGLRLYGYSTQTITAVNIDTLGEPGVPEIAVAPDGWRYTWRGEQFAYTTANHDDLQGHAVAQFLLTSSDEYTMCVGSKCWYELPEVQPPCHVDLKEAGDNPHRVLDEGLYQLSPICYGGGKDVGSLQRVVVGELPLNARVDWADPAPVRANALIWESAVDLAPSAQATNERGENAANRDLFISGAEVGVAGALMPWALQILLFDPALVGWFRRARVRSGRAKP